LYLDNIRILMGSLALQGFPSKFLPHILEKNCKFSH
jgi:hypothetical protein